MYLTREQVNLIVTTVLRISNRVDSHLRQEVGGSAGEVYLRIVARLERRCDPPENLEAFVTVAARREALRYWRRQQGLERRGKRIFIEEPIALNNQQSEWDESERNQVTHAFNCLSEIEQRLVAAKLHLNDRRSLAAIARELGKSRETARNRANRAIRRLGQLFKTPVSLEPRC